MTLSFEVGVVTFRDSPTASRQEQLLGKMCTKHYGLISL